eukprot:GEMP01055962.1.p1 GENE.GEMP01055962.1~~GEMP01055962.1.p1  ORF type:complete len:100 (+),score=2.55 GEMP01055962.1:1067-1366(+)
MTNWAFRESHPCDRKVYARVWMRMYKYVCIYACMRAGVFASVCLRLGALCLYACARLRVHEGARVYRLVCISVSEVCVRVCTHCDLRAYLFLGFLYVSS